MKRGRIPFGPFSRPFPRAPGNISTIGGLISPHSFTALQHRNYRLIWIGLLVSVTGTMMQNAALLWHVSLLVPADKKGLALGLVGLVKVAPIICLSMISGVVADAWDRRRLMLMTQAGSVLSALALAVLTFRGLS